MADTCWWSHQYGKWEEVQRGDIGKQNPDGTDKVVGIWVQQERVCKVCGFREVNLQKVKV